MRFLGLIAVAEDCGNGLIEKIKATNYKIIVRRATRNFFDLSVSRVQPGGGGKFRPSPRNRKNVVENAVISEDYF